jgi:hypothetical protein
LIFISLSLILIFFFKFFISISHLKS